MAAPALELDIDDPRVDEATAKVLARYGVRSEEDIVLMSRDRLDRLLAEIEIELGLAS